MGRIIGSALLQTIREIWQTDGRYVEEIEDGFKWWPGHHKVIVTCLPKNDQSDPDAWRLSVTTEFLKGVNCEDPKLTPLIANMGTFAPSYGWVYTPPEVSKKYNLPVDGTIEFHSATYVRPETAGWLPALFARLAIMQPIDAQRTAETIAEILGGSANKSGVRVASGSTGIDDVLNVAQAVFAPAGQVSSKWAGSEEFAAIAERFGQSDLSFGTGGPDGLTLESPFGKSSSLIRLHHDIKHPALGSGLLGTIRLPVFESLDASTSTCMWLNFFCSQHWTDAPIHGTWHPQEIRKGEFSPAYGMFVPNALYSDGLATNAALWNLCLARWARLTLWPDLQDDTMLDILNARMQHLEEIGEK
jgi:hypothetical protein